MNHGDGRGAFRHGLDQTIRRHRQDVPVGHVVRRAVGCVGDEDLIQGPEAHHDLTTAIRHDRDGIWVGADPETVGQLASRIVGDAHLDRRGRRDVVTADDQGSVAVSHCLDQTVSVQRNNGRIQHLACHVAERQQRRFVDR